MTETAMSSQARPGNLNASTHGGYSQSRIRAVARAHKRRFLRHLGVRASDLDAVTRLQLDHYCRGCARLDLFDAVDAPTNGRYWVAFNACTRAMKDLEARIKELGLDRQAPATAAQLAAHVEGRYGGNGAG